MKYSLFAGLAVASAIAVIACSEDPAVAPSITPDAGTDAAIPQIDSGPQGVPEGGARPWPETECGTCTLGQCQRQRDLCDAEPSCATHATCVEQCPTGPTGVAEAACIESCPRGEGAAATKARAAFDSCVRGAGGDTCKVSCTPPAAPNAVDYLQQQCPATSPDPTVCGSCEDLKCCQTYQACVDEPECKLQVQPCVRACAAGDHACEARCYADHPAGVLPWARRMGCIQANCLAECNAPNPVDPCVACLMQTRCRETTARCNADRECFLVSDCAEGCPNGVVDDTCLARCKEGKSAEARQLFDDFLACPLTNCVDECG